MLVFSASFIHIGKGKVFIVYTMTAYWGNTSTAPFISNPGVRYRWKDNFKVQSLFPGKGSCTWVPDDLDIFETSPGANPPSFLYSGYQVIPNSKVARASHSPPTPISC